MTHRKTLLARKAHYEALISANMLEVKFRHEESQHWVSVPGCYLSGKAYIAAHLEVIQLLSKSR